MVILLLTIIVIVLVMYFVFKVAILILFFTAVAGSALMFGIYCAFGGEVTADERGVTAVTTFFGKKIREKYIEYSDIDRTDCGVSVHHTRGYHVSYHMYFIIKKKNGSKFSVSSRLNISSSFLANEPDKYKQYLHEQPLMQLSHYIDNKLHLNTSA